MVHLMGAGQIALTTLYVFFILFTSLPTLFNLTGSSQFETPWRTKELVKERNFLGLAYLEKGKVYKADYDE